MNWTVAHQPEYWMASEFVGHKVMVPWWKALVLLGALLRVFFWGRFGKDDRIPGGL